MSAQQPPTKAAKPRRTQEERRAETIRKLFDATRESLIEVGYSNTSIQQICKRSGVSHGGLFRHFKSRIELIIAVAQDVSNALIELYKNRFMKLSETNDRYSMALRLLRDNCRAHDQQAWFELLMAARSDEVLREAMQPIWKENRIRTMEFATHAFPELSQNRDDFPAFVDCIVNQFHGEAVNAFVYTDELADAQRLQVSAGMIERYLKG